MENSTEPARGRLLVPALVLPFLVLPLNAALAAPAGPPADSASHVGAPADSTAPVVVPADSTLHVEAPAPSAPSNRAEPSAAFDFEFGEWTVQLSRLVAPLTGSTTWVEYEGVSVVRKVWNGRANLGELEVEGPDGRIQGLSLRLYDPETRQWSIRWANSRNGAMGPPMIGGFENGIGEFYNQESLNGRAIFVRFIFSDITETTFTLEQAFSDDGGKTWEANWVAHFRR